MSASAKDFDTVDLGTVQNVDGLDGDGAAAAGRGREFFGDSGVASGGRGHDVEIRQHLGAVDGDVEDAGAGGGA